LEVVEEEELAWQLAKLIESRGADNDVAGAAAAHADDEAANLVIATSLETQDYRERDQLPRPFRPFKPSGPNSPIRPTRQTTKTRSEAAARGLLHFRILFLSPPVAVIVIAI